jgi:hypothetical protein
MSIYIHDLKISGFTRSSIYIYIYMYVYICDISWLTVNYRIYQLHFTNGTKHLANIKTFLTQFLGTFVT